MAKRLPKDWPRCKVCKEPLVILSIRLVMVCPRSTEHHNDTLLLEREGKVERWSQEKPWMVVHQKSAAELLRDFGKTV
jgi:hypothetical protein